jgi:hypothetical protein
MTPLKANKPTPESVAASLTVSERVLLLCIASDTDWTNAGITGTTGRTMQVKNLIQPQSKGDELRADRARERRARGAT